MGSQSWRMPGVICTNCSSTFTTKRSFVAHLISKSCLRTSRTRRKEEKFEYPTRDNLNPVQGCEVCRRFSRAGMQMYMLSHLASHLNLRQNFKCNLCDQGFVTKLHLTKHKSRMHSRKQEECHYCQQKFKTVGMLQQHFEDSHQIRDCEECDFMTTSFTDLQEHMSSAHPQDICDQCEMAFENDLCLKEHKELIHV